MGKLATFFECPAINEGHAVRNSDGGQAATATEQTFRNVCNVAFDFDLGQLAAITKELCIIY